MYHCAQNTKRQHKSKKVDDPTKQRDKEAMVTFRCAGWLHVTITDYSDLAFVKIDHHDDHVPYFPIDIPPDVEELIRTNTQMTPTQVTVFTRSTDILLTPFHFSYGRRSSKSIQSHRSRGLQFTHYGPISPVRPGRDVMMKSNLPKFSWTRHAKIIAKSPDFIQLSPFLWLKKTV